MRIILTCTLVLAIGASLATRVSGQESAEYFRDSCAGCHTIGGGVLTGPDLKNVGERQEREWLIRFIVDPAAVIASGDAYAKKILAQHNNVPMPKTAGINAELAGRLLDLIAIESKLERSQFAGMALSDRALTEEDNRIGRDLFHGYQRLANGGPSCASCHQVAEQIGLGGGLLGPDLSSSFAKYNGRKAFGAWLANPAGVTMAPVYRESPLTEDEILPLMAYLKGMGQHADQTDQGPGIEFLILGVVGAALGLLICDVIWRRRFTGVRSRLVKGKR